MDKHTRDKMIAELVKAGADALGPLFREAGVRSFVTISDANSMELAYCQEAWLSFTAMTFYSDELGSIGFDADKVCGEDFEASKILLGSICELLVAAMRESIARNVSIRYERRELSINALKYGDYGTEKVKISKFDLEDGRLCAEASAIEGQGEIADWLRSELSK